jgi:hypothetical protein
MTCPWLRRLLGHLLGSSRRPGGRFVRPRLEMLEERTTPSSGFAAQQTFATGAGPGGMAAADVNGDGRPDLVAVNHNGNTVSVLLNTTAPYAATVPVVVADFAGYGLYRYDQSTGTWNQLHPLDPSLLAVNAAGEVVADFAGYGLYTYTSAAGWHQINGYDATAAAIDADGNIAASFAGYGTGRYVSYAGGWQPLLSPVAASQLAFDGSGNVYAGFAGYGLNEFRLATGWVRLNGADVTALAVNANGQIAAAFAGYGTYRYLGSAGGWQQLSGITAVSVAIDPAADVAADFAGYGTFLNSPSSGWEAVAANGPPTLDAQGDLYANFNGFGLWRYDPVRGWVLLDGVDAALVAAA